MAENVFDAIVVGSGISGGWAAKELTEKGLTVLMLERGRNIEHIKDYVNANKAPWEFPHRGSKTQRDPTSSEPRHPLLQRGRQPSPFAFRHSRSCGPARFGLRSRHHRRLQQG